MENKYYIIITADTNDADYITEKNEIKEDIEEWLLKYKPVIDAIKLNLGDNWLTNDIRGRSLYYSQYPDIDKNLLDNFNYYVPKGEYGVHTIESIEILVVTEEIKLL